MGGSEPLSHHYILDITILDSKPTAVEKLDRVLEVSGVSDHTLKTINIEVSEGLWRQSFRYIVSLRPEDLNTLLNNLNEAFRLERLVLSRVLESMDEPTAVEMEDDYNLAKILSEEPEEGEEPEEVEARVRATSERARDYFKRLRESFESIKGGVVESVLENYGYALIIKSKDGTRYLVRAVGEAVDCDITAESVESGVADCRVEAWLEPALYYEAVDEDGPGGLDSD